MNLKRKLTLRLRAGVFRVARMLHAMMRLVPVRISREAAVTSMRKRPMDRAQWRRWFQANRKRQRQVAALRRLGLRVDPRHVNLERWMVS